MLNGALTDTVVLTAESGHIWCHIRVVLEGFNN